MAMAMAMAMGMAMGTGTGAIPVFDSVPPELNLKQMTLQFTLGPYAPPSFPEGRLPPRVPSVAWDKKSTWDPYYFSLTFVPEFMKTEWDKLDFTEAPGLLDWLEPAAHRTYPGNSDYINVINAEIEDLLQLMRNDRERYLPEILVQQDNSPAYWAGLLGLTREKHEKTIQVLFLALRIGEIPCAFYKKEFNRPRPSHICPGLVPPFGPPAHPSFPAGHAVQAWLISLCLAKVAPDYKTQLDWLADRVAVNRERAGLHYRSDTLAGEFVAKKCFELMTGGKCPNVDTLLQSARAEWP